MNADPPETRYEINDLNKSKRQMPRETVRLLYCVSKRDRRRRFSDAVQALDEKDREENNPPERRAYLKEHQSPPANIYLHEADQKKMQENEIEKKKDALGV